MKFRKDKHPADAPGTRVQPSQDATGQADESAVPSGDTQTADRWVLYCQEAELVFDGQRVDVVGPGGLRQNLPIGWCVEVAVQPLPKPRALQLVLHFAPGAPATGNSKESPVLVVLRLFVDAPYVRDAEQMAERLRRRAPRLASPRAADEPYDLLNGEVPQAVPSADGERAPRTPEPAPGRSAEAPPTVWCAPQNGEWAFFTPMSDTVEVRDDLAGWARNLRSGHVTGP
ncbi:hypothetical protein [Actinomadura formosensis]|uniref:hypothetical protein n=1 Tax=Actinomadura formosensis TaxID=60706 RepID=UPI003D92AD3F